MILAFAKLNPLENFEVIRNLNTSSKNLLLKRLESAAQILKPVVSCYDWCACFLITILCIGLGFPVSQKYVDHSGDEQLVEKIYSLRSNKSK